MTASIILISFVPIAALTGLLAAVHAWHPDRYPTATRCAAAALATVALLALLLRK